MSTVLHVLDHSLPVQSGYASRSHSILRALAAHRVDIHALTGPKQGDTERQCDRIDGIPYRRSSLPTGKATDGVAGQLRTIRYTRRAIREQRARSQIDLVHAHSPCLNGLAVLGTGIPFVYEMRSSWEDAAVSNGQTEEGSVRYRLSRALETLVVKRADAVTVICEGLKGELLARGVAPERIVVAPNALSDELFVPAEPSDIRRLVRRYELGGRRVIGFFGSFFEWEGVDALIDVMPTVLAAVPTACLLLAGGGRQEGVLRAEVVRRGLDNVVLFTGTLSRSDVLACYGAAHLMVFPRVSSRLTEMVTPLKPLEAMAQRVPVLASSVGGHRELIREGSTGFLFPADDRDLLAQRIVELLRHDCLTDVTEQAYAWVDTERRWSAVAQRYLAVYDRLQYAARPRHLVSTDGEG